MSAPRISTTFTAVAGLLLLAACGVVGWMLLDKGGPPDDWTHAELAAHLKSRGVNVRVEGGGWSPDGTSSSVLVEDGTGERVGCLLASTSQQAKEFAASRGNTAFSWGRFAVFGGGVRSNSLRDKLHAVMR